MYKDNINVATVAYLNMKAANHYDMQYSSKNKEDR